MAVYLYRALDVDYMRVCGSINAASSENATKLLEQKQYNSIEIHESKTVIGKSSVTPKEFSIFCRQMSVTFFSNISLMEGVVLLSEQTENRQLKTALLEIHGLMNDSIPFSEALNMYPHIFSSYTLNMISIGEASGTLDTTFADLANYFEKEFKIRKKIKTAISYPIMLTVLMSAIVLLLIIRILPMFNEILVGMGGEIAPFTQVILGFSLFMSNNILVILLAVVLLIIGIIFYFKTENGKYTLDKLKMTLPISRNIYARIITTRFSRSLALLLRSGVQLLNAFDYINTLIDNAYMEEKFSEFNKKVKSGADLVTSMRELEVFPPLLLKMVTIGSKTGHLDEMLDKSAEIFDEEVDEALERLTLMIEPILIIILSIIVGIVLLSVMLPMIDIMATIG